MTSTFKKGRKKGLFVCEVHFFSQEYIKQKSLKMLIIWAIFWQKYENM